ncbi:hypothetical protein F5Y14DRAFT_459634 [Nemania sp. NC0429]|nr:hypothetical protein F5Y14DRAFT_459634 [Nemania sp. NC0429]
MGHDAYDLLKGRNGRTIRATPSKASIKSSPYLEPLTKAKPITQVDTFQWTQDHVPPGHPGHPDNRKQQSSPTTRASDRLPYEIANRKTAHEARDTKSIEATTPNERRSVFDDVTPSWRDNDPPKVRLASTPSWLRNPTKDAADATTLLHHINTTKHELHEHDHGYLSNVAVNVEKDRATNRSVISTHESNMRANPSPLRNSGGPNWESSQAISQSTALHMTQHQGIQSRSSPRYGHLRSSSNYEAEPQDKHRPALKRLRDSSSLVLKASEPLNATPEIQITPAPPRRSQPGASISVSTQRRIFEPSEDNTDTASPARKTSHIRTTPSREAQHKDPSLEAKERHPHSATQPGGEGKSGLPHNKALHKQTPNRSVGLAHDHHHDHHHHHHHSSNQEDLDHDGTNSLFVRHPSSGPEIASPTPIAPPNHECDWKDRYLGLTAEIRQLKAEMSSARASLTGSDIGTTARSEQQQQQQQCGDVADLLGATIIMHFRDRGDVVVSTDVVEEDPPSAD